MSLRARTAKNIGIVAFLQLFASAINIITLVVLARLLTPFDFGVVGLVAVVLGVIGQFNDFGLGPAVIQRQKDIEEALYTGGALRIIMALGLFVLSFLLAPYVAVLFNTPEMTNVMRIAALMFFLSSAGFVSTNRLTKELEFGKIAYVTVVISVTSSITSVLIALIWQTYWAMIVGPMIGSLLGLLALYKVCPWKARFRIDRRIAKELIAYGKHVFLMIFIMFLVANLDDAVVASVLGVTILGYYYVAYRWSNVVAGFLLKLAYRVMFPTFSQIQEDRARLKRGYVEMLRIISLASFPTYFGFIIVAPDFVNVLLGSEWSRAILPLQILCLFGLINVLATPAGHVFLAIGKSKLLSMSNLLNLIILLVFIYPAASMYGLEGVSVLVVIMYLIYMIVMFWLATRNIDISFSEIGDIFRGPFLSAFAMLLLIVILRAILGFGLVPFIAIVIAGVGVYSVLIYAYQGELIRGYYHELRSIIKGQP